MSKIDILHWDILKEATMKDYRVGYHYEEAGTVTVQANSAPEAEATVYNHLEEHGLENMGNCETHHRNYSTEVE